MLFSSRSRDRGEFDYPTDPFAPSVLQPPMDSTTAVIGKLLVDEKKMTLEEVTIPAIRAYLQAILKTDNAFCSTIRASYFFTWSDHFHPQEAAARHLLREINRHGLAALPGGSYRLFGFAETVVDQEGIITGWIHSIVSSFHRIQEQPSKGPDESMSFGATVTMPRLPPTT